MSIFAKKGSLIPPSLLPPMLRLAPPGVTLVMLNRQEQPVSPGSLRSALAAAQYFRAQTIEAELLLIDCASRNGSLVLLRQLEAIYFESGLRLLALPQPVSKMGAWNVALIKATHRTILFMNEAQSVVVDNLYSCYRAMQTEIAAAAYPMSHPLPTATLLNQQDDTQLHPIKPFILFDRLQLFDLGGFAEQPPRSDDEINHLLAYLSASGRKLLAVPPASPRTHPLTDHSTAY